MSVLGFCEWLEGTPVAQMVREAPWGFQTLGAIHILGLSLSVGTLVWFDLRLLGVAMPRIRVSELYRRLFPWAAFGFLSMITTGLLLFAGSASSVYHNGYFRFKLVALALAAANAVVYHLMTERSIARWDASPRPPVGARLAGMISIALWASVIVAGRMISYTMY